jgi:hypothetical protein
MTKKKQKIVHGQKILSGFVGVPEPVVEEQADVSVGFFGIGGSIDH